jgi:hypothetical protein
MEDYKEESNLSEYNEKVNKVKTLSKKNKATALAFAVLFATSAAFMGCTPKNEDEEEQSGSSGTSSGYHYYGGSSGSSSSTKKSSFWGKPSSGSSSYSSGKSGVSG